MMLLVGITSANRPGVAADGRLLKRTMDSVMASGLPRPRVFFDGFPEMESPNEVFLHSIRFETIGPWPNMRYAMTEMRAMVPDAVQLILQDDIELTSGLNPEMLERIANQCGDGGVISLYCTAYQEHQHRCGKLPIEHEYLLPGVDGIERHEDRQSVSRWILGDNKQFFGALAVLINAKTRDRLLENPPRIASQNGSDTSLGRFCRDAMVPYFIHWPSLVRHTGIGEFSSLFHGWRPSTVHRQAGTFLPALGGATCQRLEIVDGHETWAEIPVDWTR